MFVICHVILQDHMTQESCDYMGRGPLRKVTTLPSLVAIDTGSGDIHWF